jgi:type IV secretion system protein VirB2
MAPKQHNPFIEHQAKSVLSGMIVGFILLAMMLLPELAFAADQTDAFGDTGQKVCGFFGNINKILNMSSIAVVTAAVVFSGYQIAFAHKRIGDVAPVLVGGVFIGAAGQVAKMVIGTDTNPTACSVTSITPVVQYLWAHYA